MHTLHKVSQVGVPEALERAVQGGTGGLLALQRADGHFAFELEADATIPAEYILLDHFTGRINQPLHERMANYLRAIQEEHGGWPLFHRGAFDMSASVKAYFALKCAGDDVNAPHMVRARGAILERGGAETSNVFTRIQLALFAAVPWRAVPVMPVEIMLLPRWFPFHLGKIAYWSRTVIVPLLVLMAKKPRAMNPRGITVDELFVALPEDVKNWHTNRSDSIWNPVFRGIDAVLRAIEPYMPGFFRRLAIRRAEAWVKERLNGEDGLGAIYPAMANAVMMFDCLGYAPEHPDYAVARLAIDKMVVDGKKSTLHTPPLTPPQGEGDRPSVPRDQAYCQPCLSPVWDTGLAAHALMEAGADKAAIEKACDWLIGKQVLDVKGDWAEARPKVRPGGWAFQYNNAYYPDLDDTAMVVMALDRLDKDKYAAAIDRAVEWTLGLQSKNGGWAAFDADNTYYYLNHIPFADHGALLDPPSADVTARCLSMLGQLGYQKDHPAVAAAIEYLRREQEPEGCWFGRWGTNYIYGTWSVLCALNVIGVSPRDEMVRRAADWLLSKQREDGGWGEDGASYWSGQPKGEGPVSTPSQTAWALLGLMAAGDVDHPAVAKGVEHLVATQNEEGLWDEEYFTSVGFPRVFYLRYHGYKNFFPLWAMARYNNLQQSNALQVMVGM